MIPGNLVTAHAELDNHAESLDALELAADWHKPYVGRIRLRSAAGSVLEVRLSILQQVRALRSSQYVVEHTISDIHTVYLKALRQPCRESTS